MPLAWAYPMAAGVPDSGTGMTRSASAGRSPRSEEHTSELQSRQYLVCRLLLEKKKKKKIRRTSEKEYEIKEMLHRTEERENVTERDKGEYGIRQHKNTDGNTKRINNAASILLL